MRAEAKQGLRPWHATPSGLIGPDYAHVLVVGERSYAGIADGALFYSPRLDEAALVEVDGDEAVITVGPLNLDQALGRGKALLKDAVYAAVNAYGEDGNGVVSRWLVSLVQCAALDAYQRDGLDGFRAVVPRDPDMIWETLGRRWVVQPWGLGTENEILGDWSP